VFGPVNVAAGAGFRSTDSAIIGRVTASGAAEVTVCGTLVLGNVRSTGASAVTIGDPGNGCAGNIILGSVRVDSTAGPSVIGGNGILGTLACTANEPPPVNGGSANTVLGGRTGQCSGL
jgi:hexosaminidase